MPFEIRGGRRTRVNVQVIAEDLFTALVVPLARPGPGSVVRPDSRADSTGTQVMTGADTPGLSDSEAAICRR